MIITNGCTERLQELLRVGVSKTELPDHDKQGFFISVTEEEVGFRND